MQLIFFGCIKVLGIVNSIKIFVNSISELTMELKLVCEHLLEENNNNSDKKDKIG